MNEQEAMSLCTLSGSTDIGTARSLVEMFPKEIEEYTKADFQTITPYEYIYLYRFNEFEQGIIISKMADQAKKVGFSNFHSMYKKFRNSKSDDNDYDEADNNYTNFHNQPLSLRCGKWVCDDSGVRMATQYGITYACPHAIMPVARMCNIDTGIEKVKVAYRRGRAWRTAVFDRKTLSSANKIIDLADCGIAVTSENARDLVKYFYEVEQLNPDALPEIECVTHLGWIDRGEGLEFVPYTDDVVFDGEQEYRQRFESVSQKGDFKDWLDAMDMYIRENPNPMARIVFAASLSSVLIKLLECNCYWLHLWGGAGTAKTVLTMCAASIWGNPERGKYLTTFDSTVVGCEKSAAFSGSMPYMMDELQLVDVRKNMDQIIYMLTEGCGRTRGNKYGGLDTVSQWRNCVLSTGERPINSLSSGGGAMARVIEVECKTSFFDDARKVLGVITQNYGWFGKAYIGLLQKKTKEELEELYSKHYKSLSDKGIMDKQVQSGALLLMADELACELYFDPKTQLTVDDILPFLKTKAEVDVNARGYEYICEQVAANQYRFIKDENRPGELWGTIEGDSVYIIKSNFTKMCLDGGFNPQALLSWLNDRGLISRNGKNLTVAKRVNNVPTRCVHMMLCDEDEESDDYIEI